MKAMQIERAGEALRMRSLDVPSPGPGQVLVRVRACGVCRTDLHLVDGELPACRYPITPGHEIVGTLDGTNVRVGVPWLGWTCGECDDCRRDAEAAPLLCAGLIGFRCYRKCGEAGNLGLYGFGAAAHILAQIARADGRQVFAFSRPGDRAGQAFAIECGAHWAGDSNTLPPEPLDAAIIFAPVGALVPQALKATRKGGRVVCGGIHMSDLPAFPYALLWGERRIESVANLTREDGARFMAKAKDVFLKTSVTAYRLDQANAALGDLRAGRFSGAAVLVP